MRFVAGAPERARSAALVAAIVAALAGCSGDTERLSCPYPAGTSCESLSEVYERTTGSAVDGEPERAAQSAEKNDVDGEIAPRVSTLLVLPGLPFPGGPRAEPVLEPPRVMRVWLAPWQDEDGDLRGAQYLHLVLAPPSWRAEVAAPASRKRRTAGKQLE